ncbi:hypothetical protein [Nocardioides campestrisoli]|uniref:hypothetical protein n=1 Tax=Nocardioides campestrisoli TaxID=2736757 RepID=UPI00163D48CA|nr:hypothetical protein [Nocardioides campestrisoli]
MTSPKDTPRSDQPGETAEAEQSREHGEELPDQLQQGQEGVTQAGPPTDPSNPTG